MAVSGGADSVALLRVLTALDQRLAVGHVHHGLREQADHDCAFVASLARKWGLRFSERRVAAATRDGRSPEARARALRYAALESLREELDCHWVATAHTCDDQAETVLFRATRGTGPDGLAAIEPRSGALVRPLLAVRRKSLRAYLAERGEGWREDLSNADLRVPRNALRARVLPVLEEIQPGAIEKLAALAELARLARDEGRPAVETALAGSSRPAQQGLWIDPEPLAVLNPLNQRRALRALLVSAGIGDRITRRHVERVNRFLEQAPRGASLSLPAALALVRKGERFWLGPAPGRRA